MQIAPMMKPSVGFVLKVLAKSKANTDVTSQIRGKGQKISWVDWNEKEMKGTYIAHPERESVPENIKEQLIVELYSK